MTMKFCLMITIQIKFGLMIARIYGYLSNTTYLHTLTAGQNLLAELF